MNQRWGRTPTRRAGRRGARAGLLLGAATLVAACSSARAATEVTSATTAPPIPVTAGVPAPTTTTVPDTTVPDTTVPDTTEPGTSAPDTSAPDITVATTRPATSTPDSTTPDTSTPDTSEPDTTQTSLASHPPVDHGDLRLPNLDLAFTRLAGANAAVSLTVWRDHQPVYGQAWGLTTSGVPMTSDSPLVIASVSKLITALSIARLAEQGELDVYAPVPWDRLFIAHDPAWNDVTVRELLDHTSGMPKAQDIWTGPPGSCAIPLGAAISRPPTLARGTWTYSNGNYCALGLLVESLTDDDRAAAADDLIFDPIGVTGPHLTTDGLLPGDGPHPDRLARLERLGGAGTWMASTDDLAAMLDAMTTDDLATLRYPGIITDQYGWGHTGTVDGAKSCAWVVEGGRTVVVATIAGSRPATGGKVCDEVIPALAADLGFWAGEPIRIPI